MKRIVQKFGGTSLANVDLIKKAALHTKQAWDQGHQVAVVVSAMAGTTNELVKWVQQTGLSHALSLASSDTILAAGEQITSGLFALCLQNYGIPARPWQGWQLPIYTTGSFGTASIATMDLTEMRADFDYRIVPVISGFQGINDQKCITTLGRGGSDTTAVALAATLQADYCAIFTDVDGVYTADPRIVPKAHKISFIDYEEMLEMASLGAKVLHPRSVAIALQYQVKIWTLSSFLPVNNACGTWIMQQPSEIESTRVTGIAHQLDLIKITIESLSEHETFLEQLLNLWAANHIIIEDLYHIKETTTQKTGFFIHKNQQETVHFYLQKNQSFLKIQQWHQDNTLARISLIGHGFKRDCTLVPQLLRVLKQDHIAIFSFTQNDRAITITILAVHLETTLRQLHTLYGLDKGKNE